MSVTILALDTSTENCSFALIVGDKVYSRCEFAPRDHTKKILPMVDEVLTEAGVRLTDVDALAFGRGPGSFTGVRIGIGIAQGLAFGADLPMIGISTLAAMAQGCYRQYQATQVVAAIDARMSEVYWGQYQRQTDGQWCALPLFDNQLECVIAPELIADYLNSNSCVNKNDHLNTNGHLDQKQTVWMAVGTGWDAYQDKLSALPLNLHPSLVWAEKLLYPQAQDIAVLAKFEWQKGNVVTAEEATPTYLRDTVTWKKLPGRE